MTHDAQDAPDIEQLSWLMDALEAVNYHWSLFMDATRPYDQAQAIIRLNDSISDLSSYHPTYDPETSTLGWERDNDD